MHYSTKQLLFDDFMKTWSERFSNIPFLLKFLTTYPSLFDEIKDFNPIQPKKLIESQLEWIALLSQLDNPIESDFFKPFWVPIHSDGYSYFIDLSTDKYSLFDANFISIEPCKWFKTYLAEDLPALMIELDNEDFDFENFSFDIKLNRDSEIIKFAKGRKDCKS